MQKIILALLLLPLALCGVVHAETVIGSHTETVMITSSTVVKDWEIQYSTSGVVSFWLQGRQVSPDIFANNVELKRDHPCPKNNNWWGNGTISTEINYHAN